MCAGKGGGERMNHVHLRSGGMQISQSKYRKAVSCILTRESEALARVEQQEHRERVLREMQQARGEERPEKKRATKFRMLTDEELSSLE